MDNNEYDFDKSYECVAGIGAIKSITSEKAKSLKELNEFKLETSDWIFGHVAYDLKNKIESLSSENPDEIGFPDFQFFVPEIILILSTTKVEIGVFPGQVADRIFEEIISFVTVDQEASSIYLKKRFPKNEYLETVKRLQQHILRGDCYEICFCQELYAENIQIDPVKVFKKLSALSPNPFSSFYRSGKKYLMCASPERFLKKTNNTIISQPIKGTSRRNNADIEDEEEKNLLLLNEKERAENTMIVDLVRNDLSKICAEGSVAVKEFLKIYSFPQVHQMISTISGTLCENISFSEIL
ncbi:MAG: chorismate-binding protein, partial [Ginsengibacter sp.]